VNLDPETMKFAEVEKDNGGSPIKNASTAIEVDGILWLGQFSGGRIGYKPGN
jgi:hypothetical protein